MVPLKVQTSFLLIYRPERRIYIMFANYNFFIYNCYIFVFPSDGFFPSYKNFTRSCSISSGIEDSLITLTLESSWFKGQSLVFFFFCLYYISIRLLLLICFSWYFGRLCRGLIAFFRFFLIIDYLLCPQLGRHLYSLMVHQWNCFHAMDPSPT